MGVPVVISLKMPERNSTLSDSFLEEVNLDFQGLLLLHLILIIYDYKI